MSAFYARITKSARRTVPTARGHHGVYHPSGKLGWRYRDPGIWRDDETGRDKYEVRQIPWHGKGLSCTIATGFIGEEESE